MSISKVETSKCYLFGILQDLIYRNSLTGGICIPGGTKANLWA